MRVAPPRYAFHFDSSACAGCKACQIACKDKHGLEVGRVWRRVYDVTGGEWKREGEAWKSDVFAFHLSIGCNHCADSICVEGCPSRALKQREDGIVTLDTERCLGCRYCEWACPYGAPQYDRARGHMTKCTFCADELDEGREPVCVTACPLRVLELGVGEANAPLMENGGRQDPLPDPQLTAPALLMEEHRDAARARREAVEVIPRQRYELHEWSLVVFTLLTQLAAGVVLWSFGLSLFVDRGFVGTPVWAVATVAMLVALLTSLRHLGSPTRAPWALAHLPGSWLSQEIFTALSFLFVCATILVVETSEVASVAADPIALILASLLGLRLVLVISRVYRLRTVPTWESRWTTLSFLTTSVLLGGLAFLAIQLRNHEHLDPYLPLVGGTAILTIVRQLIGEARIRHAGSASPETATPGRLAAFLSFMPPVAVLLLIASILAAVETWSPIPHALFLVPAIVLLLVFEALDRHRFFKSYVRCGI